MLTASEAKDRSSLPEHEAMAGLGKTGTLNVPEAYNMVDNALSAIAATLGVVMLLSLAVILAHVPVLRSGLGSIGTKTLEIYLAHVMVVAGTRIVLDSLGSNSEIVFLAVAMLLGIAAPLALAALAPRLHLTWLFQAPGVIGAWSRTANGTAAPTKAS